MSVTQARKLIAIDPGDRYTGVAQFHIGVRAPSQLKLTFTSGPREFEDWLAATIERHKLSGMSRLQVVYEEFRLYPGAAQAQGYSEMLTPQLIGVIRYLCRRGGVACEAQPALIKKPTRAVMAHRGLEETGGTLHERDAEVHGWHWIIRKGPQTPS